MRDGFVDHCLELLAPVGAVRARRMFGGHGLYIDELFVAIVAAERLYLKVDAQTRPSFAAAGGTPFVYDAKSGAVAMSYSSPPAEALESPALMRPWARLAVEAALRARALKAPAAPRRKPARAPATAAAPSRAKPAPPRAAKARPR